MLDYQVSLTETQHGFYIDAGSRHETDPDTSNSFEGENIPSISCFPGGQWMISSSSDKTAQQWYLKAGKGIEEACGVCERSPYAVVSRNGQWVATAGGDFDRAELKACGDCQNI
jgi:WD40 repeat protein